MWSVFATALAALSSGALVGLASAPHCAAMCGPVCAAACAGDAPARGRLLRYQLGRVLGYGFAGLLSGQAGRALEPLWTGAAARVALSALVVACTLWVVVRLLGPSGSGAPAIPASRLRRRAPIGAALLRVLPRDQGVLGLLSTLLPCGALYAALALAAATRRADLGALLMLGFCLVSGLSMGVVAVGVRGLDPRRRRLGARLSAALIVAAAGFWLARPLYADPPGGAAPPGHVACH